MQLLSGAMFNWKSKILWNVMTYFPLMQLWEHYLRFISENVLISFQVAPQSSLLLPSTMSFPKRKHQKPLLRPRSLSAPHRKRAPELLLLSVSLKVPLQLLYLRTQVITAWNDQMFPFRVRKNKSFFSPPSLQKEEEEKSVVQWVHYKEEIHLVASHIQGRVTSGIRRG